MNKECKNCKYHKIDEIVFANPQSICTKNNKIIEGWFGCADYEFFLTTEERKLIMIALLNLQKTYHKIISEPATAIEIKEVANLYGEELYKINKLLDKLGE